MMTTKPEVTMAAVRRRTQSAETDVAFTAAANVAMVVISLVTGPLVARLLGPGGRGELGVIQAWPLLISSLSQLGQSEAIVYFSSRNRCKTDEYMITGTVVALAGSVALGMIAYLLLPLLLRGPNAYLVASARRYLWLAPLSVLLYVPAQAMRQSGRLLVWNICRLLPVAAWAAIVVIAQLRSKASASWLAHQHLLVLACLVPIILFITARQSHIRLSLSGETFRPMAKYGILSCLGTTSNLLNQRVDQLVMVLLLPTAPIGLYAAGGGWASGFGTAITAISLVTLPRIASRSARDSTETFFKWVRASAVVIFSLVMLSLITTPFIFPLFFGDSFRPAIGCCMILLLGAAVCGFNLVLEDGLRGLGHPQGVMVAETAGWVSMLAAVTAVVSRANLMLLAGASLLGYVVATAVLFYQIRYRLGCSPWRCRPTREDALLVVNRGRILIEAFLQRRAAALA
jgi:enterobacterial common antigen flippase